MPPIRILVAALLLLAPTLLVGPAPVSAGTVPRPTGPDSIKYWVFLRDKVDVAGKTAPVPVAARALQRRLGRGAPSADADLDREVSGAYVRRLQSMGIDPLVRSRWLNAVSAWMSEEEAAVVSALPFVNGIRPVGSAVPVGDVDGPVTLVDSGRPGRRVDFGPSLTQLSVAGAVAPLQAGWNGQGVRLGIIDTGLGDPSTHPALSHLVTSGRFLSSRDFTGLPDDGNRHARMVLSVAAGYHDGNLVGPAWGAEILHARTEYYLSETNQEEDNFVAGLEWMEAEGVDVVNVSLGYSVFDAGQRSYVYAEMDGKTAVTTRAAEHAASLGVVMVVAAANEGCASPQLCWYYVTSPADGPSVITVGGVSANLVRSSFSGYGPTADGRTKPDVAAMAGESFQLGVYVANSGTGYVRGNGTSFAAPMVSGIVTLLLQADPSLTPLQIRDLLRATASQAQSPDNSLGWGIVNAEAALARVTSVERPKHASTRSELHAWPNPFRDRLVLYAPTDTSMQPARVEFYDLLGRRVADLAVPSAGAGTWQIDLDGTALPAGVVLYRFTAGGRESSGSLVHAR